MCHLFPFEREDFFVDPVISTTVTTFCRHDRGTPGGASRMEDFASTGRGRTDGPAGGRRPDLFVANAVIGPPHRRGRRTRILTASFELIVPGRLEGESGTVVLSGGLAVFAADPRVGDSRPTECHCRRTKGVFVIIKAT